MHIFPTALQIWISPGTIFHEMLCCLMCLSGHESALYHGHNA